MSKRQETTVGHENMPSPDNEIKPLKEWGAELNIPLATMRYYRAQGRGPRTWKLGGRVVAYRRDVEAWLREQYEAETKVG